MSGAKKYAIQQNWLEADQLYASALKAVGDVQTAPDAVKAFIPQDFDPAKRQAEITRQRQAISGPVAQLIAKQDRDEKKRQADEAAASAATATRGEEPGRDIDGCCIECKQYLKQVMNDLDSYECGAATLPQIEGEYWTVVMSYRGKNGFGAITLETKKFFIQSGQVAKTDP